MCLAEDGEMRVRGGLAPQDALPPKLARPNGQVPA
jgi:hypothetical protein